MGLADRTCAHACDDIIIGAAIKGRPPTQQDVQHNAGTPHISQLVIVSPQHLWCNIIRLRGAQPGGGQECGGEREDEEGDFNFQSKSNTQVASGQAKCAPPCFRTVPNFLHRRLPGTQNVEQP